MADGTDPRSAAQHLLAQRRAGQPFRPLAEAQRHGLAHAYAIQRELFAAAGLTRAGWKVALNTRASQDFCGAAEPISGLLPREGQLHGPCRIARAEFDRLGLEMELAVRIGAPLPADPADRNDIARCIDRVCAAIEVIDDRSADYRRLDAASLVADNCWNRAFVLGELDALGDAAALTGAACTLHVDGAAIAAGEITAEVDPLAMVGWLERHLRGRGLALQPGDWVMTGNLLPSQFPAQPSRYRFRIASHLAVELEIR